MYTMTQQHLDAIRERFIDGSSHPDDLRDLIDEYNVLAGTAAELRIENNRLHAGITNAIELLDNSDSTIAQNATEILEKAK